MTKRKIIVIHSIVFLVLSFVLFFSAGTILNGLVPEIENVRLWLDLIIYGTILILILTTVSCLVFLKQRKAIGTFIILVNILPLWFSANFLYRYHFTEFHPTYRMPDWSLILNAVLAIVGFIIGYKTLTTKLSLILAVFIALLLIIIGIVAIQF
ncbi:MAG: hypothetical protein ACSHXG_15930 [Maribacter stanieri]